MHILLMYSTHKPSAEHVDRLAAISTQVTVAKSESMAIQEAGNADVILGHRYLRQCLPYAERLRWVQSTAGGVDQLPWLELAHKNVLLTRMTLSSPVIARHAVTLAWAVARQLNVACQRHAAGQWDASFDWLPFPRKAVVFGTGSIGQAIAALLSLDNIEVIGVKRTVAGESIPGFTHLCGSTSWLDVLPQVDWCFLTLPHTAETKDLIDEAALRMLPNHAVLVNVGRGETLVTTDLCRVLVEGHLGGAALDVVYPKPSGVEDPIWQTPRLLITPHVAAHEHNRETAIELFCEEQLARFTAGQFLHNLVDTASLMNK